MQPGGPLSTNDPTEHRDEADWHAGLHATASRQPVAPTAYRNVSPPFGHSRAYPVQRAVVPHETLTHELDTAQDARSPLAHALRLREQAVTGRIQQIGVDLAHQETEVRARMEHTQQSLSQLMGSLQQCANNLWELIRPVTGRLDLSGDPELAQLLVAAGPS